MALQRVMQGVLGASGTMQGFSDLGLVLGLGLGLSGQAVLGLLREPLCIDQRTCRLRVDQGHELG